jgi:hypothetical protein
MYFRDRNQNLRLIIAEQEVDLNKQKQLKHYIESETNIQVFSPILSVVK